MSDEGQDAWKRFLKRYLEGHDGEPRSETATPAEAPRWTVRQLGPERFGVVRANDPRQLVPDAVFQERSTAYMAAAVLTALGPDQLQTVPVPVGKASLPPPLEVREQGLPGGEFGLPPELTLKLLQALVKNPAAIELLLQGMDDATVERARAYLLAHWKGPSGDIVN